MGCEGLVESAVRTLGGVVTADASYRQGIVVVEYEPDSLTPDQIAGAIDTQTYYRTTGVVEGGAEVAGASEEGLSVGQGVTAVIQVDGMTDDLAASEVMSSMGAEGAITDAAIDLSASTLTVEYDASKTNAGFLALAITGYTDYSATVLSTTEAQASAGAAAKTFDYAKYGVWGIAALVAAALAWSGLRWGRRQRAPAAAPLTKAARRRQRRRERDRPPK